MKISSENLIEDLIQRTKDNMNEAQQLSELTLEQLNSRPAPESWSALECIEHLNLYGDYYIPEISKRIKGSRTTADDMFKSGLIGNYFAESLLPKEKLNKMKTFKDKNPIGSKLDKHAIERFIEQQKVLLDLLNKAREVSLNKTKTSISITRLLKLKLGDTFRVVIYHNQRHLVQARKAVEAAKS